jgi:DNA-binding LacI/PurR family transcriptional regulator
MPRVNFNAVERENAYIDSMRALGHTPVIIGTDLTHEGWHFEAHGEAVLDECFSRGHYTEQSILCANDRVAIGALRAAARHGLVPGRGPKGGLRIAGHDDYPLCPFTVPALTTVAQDFEAIGRTAVSRLVDMIGGESAGAKKQVHLFEGVLKLRESA